MGRDTLRLNFELENVHIIFFGFRSLAKSFKTTERQHMNEI